MSSSTMVTAPIVAAIVKSEDILGEERVWHAINDEQTKFLAKFFSYRHELASFSESELRSWVGWVAAELNAILAKEGFDIKLQDFTDGEFGVVSILDVLVEWLVKGEKSSLYNAATRTHYPAVRMEPSAVIDCVSTALFRAYRSQHHLHPVVMLPTKSGDRVYMTVAGEAASGFELVNRIDEIRSFMDPSGRYEYLMFPAVDLNQTVDIGWLKGMHTSVAKSGDRAAISQALQQTKFKMNEEGARVKSAVAIGMRTVSIRMETPLIIDEPFFLWIERDGVTVPVMYAYLDTDAWKDPENFDL